jgi:hypothetical protein
VRDSSTKSSSEPALQAEQASRDSSGLEFPDWTGKLPHPRRMSFEEACRWNDEMLELFPPKSRERNQDAEICSAEFVL